MTKISNQDVYIVDTEVSDLDSIIGTDGNTTAKTTKNFLMGKLKAYFKSGLSPLTGGTLRFTEITYTGGLYATVEEMVNALDPFFTIDQYHVVVVTFNGAKSILKLQNVEVGLDKTPVVAGDFITMTSTIDAVLATGNTTNEAINFVDGTASANVNAYQAQFTDGSNNSYRMQSNGILSYNPAQNYTFWKLPVKPLQNVIFQTPLKDVGTYTVALATDIPTVESSSLSVTQEGSVITIELPVVSDIPSLIVNDLYIPTYADFLLGKTKGNGTASKPFTNTITYTAPTVYTTAPNTAIQNALDAYKGTGGKGTIADPTNPQLLGSIIQIEKGSGTYNFTGDFDYLDLKLQLKAGVIIGSTPIGEYLMDFTKFSTTKSHNPTIYIEEGAYIFCQKNGFKIVGGDFILGSEDKKTLNINGGNNNTGIVLIGNVESHTLFEVNGGSETYINGSFPNLVINSFIATRRGRMFVIKGNGRVLCQSAILYFLTEPNLVTITNTYSPIEIEGTGFIGIYNSDVTLNKTSLVTYNQLVSLDNSALFEAIDSKLVGDSVYLAYCKNISNTPVIRLDACKMYISTTNSFANTISGIWQNIILTNNNMPNTSINATTTEILPSSINTIGSKIIETLSSYTSKALASAVLPKGGAFIKVTYVSAVDLIAGVEYKITTVGTPSLGTLNTYFIATGSETGTGVGTLYERDIVI